ncbi:glutathione synthetase [Pseudomonas sp. Marseille-Q5299]|uniref:glutathione synthetase n=1 Tax=Pseudomonas sp. Marseille-Q5299 TaxID=2942201 RepID=UPI002073E538|nr:glutathione synthetase [Pseudomonas sp. Marseille-Q5299]
MSFIEPGIGELNAKQRFLWEQYKAMTRQFAHDMLLAEGNSEEIDRRLGIQRSDYLPPTD